MGEDNKYHRVEAKISLLNYRSKCRITMHCHKLPSLPGMSFEERLKRNHHVPQSFFYQNGHRLNRVPTVAIGKEPLGETFKEFSSSSEPIE